MIKAELVDHMGSDLSVVNAARVSFAKESDWEYDLCDCDIDAKDNCETCTCEEGRYLKDADVKLIKFLAREKHELPFAHTAITLRCSAPIPQRTHCFKSKVGFVENEESRRYIDSRPELFVPEFREAVKDKKQGSGSEHCNNIAWQAEYEYHCKRAISLYLDMIDDNVCPEQSRYILPQGVMVNWIWTGSLLAYARFYKLRSKTDTQKETQIIAQQIDKIMADLYPWSWAALTSGVARD